MSGGSRDDTRRLLEWLVPEGGEARQRAERVLDFSRALDAATRESTGPGLAEARRAFDDEVRARAVGALEDLLVHHLAAVHLRASFAPLPTPRTTAQAAWQSVALLRDSIAGLPGVPAPGEGALAVAGRLLGGLYQLGGEEGRLELWHARLAHAAGGARVGERAFRERLEQTPARGRGSRPFPELLAGLVACLLDRGAVREAEAVLEEHRDLNEGRGLQRLRAWTRLVRGERVAEFARGSLDDLPFSEWPLALVELAGDWEELGAAVGSAPEPPEGELALAADLETPPFRDRCDCGASALAVFAFGLGRSVELLHLDVAPGLRGRVQAWLDEREGASFVRERPEHSLVVEAAPQRLHGTGLPSALGPGARALALTPVLDEEGEVSGWLHLEFEHHLVPERVRLQRHAATWRLPLLRRSAQRSERGLFHSDQVSEERAEPARWILGGELGGRAGELCGETFRALARALGIKLRQRRWWAFAVEDGQARFVNSGGEGLAGDGNGTGGGRALDRCMSTGGVITFDESDPRLAIHGQSASGVVLPLIEGGAVVGLFAVESGRRRDFKGVDLDHLAQLASEIALPLGLARFRAWHLERHGYDLYFDSGDEALREFSERVLIAARSRSPLVLSGPAGAGKRVIARWVQWRAGHVDGRLEVFHAELDGCDPERCAAWRERLSEGPGTFLVEDVGSLAPELQEELLRALEAPTAEGVDRQWIATTTTSLAACVEAGDLRPDLAARLDRFQLFVPGLADRRRDVPGLTRFFAARFAAEEGCEAPVFDDAALALLWRQRWPGHLRDLEALVFKLVVLHPGETLGPEELRSVARRFKLDLREKLPSRRPRRADLVQALRSSLTGTGRINKRRAAALLGWDPDTLVARMDDAGLDGDALEVEPEVWGG